MGGKSFIQKCDQLINSMSICTGIIAKEVAVLLDRALSFIVLILYPDSRICYHAATIFKRTFTVDSKSLSGSNYPSIQKITILKTLNPYIILT